MGADDKQGSWWQTVPGVITGVGTLLGALTGLIIALNQAGVLHGPSAAPTAASTVSATTVAPMKTATLPSVTGVPLADAEQVLRSLGFTDIREVRKFSAAVPGTVIEQVPNPGTNLPLGPTCQPDGRSIDRRTEEELSKENLRSVVRIPCR